MRTRVRLVGVAWLSAALSVGDFRQSPWRPEPGAPPAPWEGGIDSPHPRALNFGPLTLGDITGQRRSRCTNSSLTTNDTIHRDHRQLGLTANDYFGNPGLRLPATPDAQGDIEVGAPTPPARSTSSSFPDRSDTRTPTINVTDSPGIPGVSVELSGSGTMAAPRSVQKAAVAHFGDAGFFGDLTRDRAQQAHRRHRPDRRQRRLLAGGVRWRHLQLRGRRILRVRRQHHAQQAHRGHRADRRRRWLLAGGHRRWHF